MLHKERLIYFIICQLHACQLPFTTIHEFHAFFHVLLYIAKLWHRDRYRDSYLYHNCCLPIFKDALALLRSCFIVKIVCFFPNINSCIEKKTKVCINF